MKAMPTAREQHHDDQMQMELRSLASAVGELHRSLKDGLVPDDLISLLIRDFAEDYRLDVLIPIWRDRLGVEGRPSRSAPR